MKQSGGKSGSYEIWASLKKNRKLYIIGVIILISVDLADSLTPLVLKWVIDDLLLGLSSKTSAAALSAVTGSGIPGAVPVYFLTDTAIWRNALLYLALMFLVGLGRYGWRMYLARASHISGGERRDQFVVHLFSLSLPFFQRRRMGDLMSLATSDTDAIRTALGPGMLTLVDGIVLFIFGFCALLSMSWKLTLIAMIPFPLIPLIVTTFEKWIHDAHEETQEMAGVVSSFAQEAVGGIRVTKAFVVEQEIENRFQNLSLKLRKASLKLSKLTSSFGPLLDLTMTIGTLIFLVAGSKMFLNESISIGTFVAFSRYLQRLTWPMIAIGLALTHFQRGIASNRRLQEVEEERPDVENAPTPKHIGDANSGIALKGAIEFRNLTFSYGGHGGEVLKNISLKINPGERIAIIGEIGSGKTTLVSLIPRLYPIEKGTLFIDGEDVCNYDLANLRHQIGFVSQDLFLFSDTVRENVLFGTESRKLVNSSAHFEKAIHDAEVADDVSNMSERQNTIVGERGVMLSGGQKQRLCIARALSIDPQILILDDALSAVDVRTEEKLLLKLRSRRKHPVTEIVVAHRLSTIRDADRIVFLESGIIRQCGPHHELIQDQSGPYFRFYEQQRLKEELQNVI